MSNPAKVFLLIAGSMALLVSRASAANPPAEALIDRRWFIGDEKQGRIIATHLLRTAAALFPGAGSGLLPVRAYLTLTFQPQTVKHTGCVAHIVGYTKFSNKANDPWEGPYPMADAVLTKEIQTTMAKAEKRLVAKHPEYALK